MVIDMDDDLIRKARNCLWLRRVTWAVICVLAYAAIKKAMGG